MVKFEIIMDASDELKELQARVDALVLDVKKCNEEIRDLKSRLAPKTVEPISGTGQELKYPSQFENFIGLKLIHFVGIVVLIAGLTIGVKYAIDINIISPFIRIALAYAAGIFMFVISKLLFKKYEVFSMILFSGAMAAVYLTTYAAFAYYGMFTRTIAFALMLVITLFTIFNSLRFNKQEIAVLALVGAYGIPFFVGGDSANIVGLFTYVFIINSGILFLSFKRYWLLLSYLAFFVTWIMVFTSMVTHPASNFTLANMFFCLLFFLLFLINSLAFKLVRKLPIAASDTSVIIFNSLFLYFALLTLFGIDSPSYRWGITILFAVLYLIAGLLTNVFLRKQVLLSDAFFGISLMAFIVFFALRFSGFPVTIVWVVLAIVSFVLGTWFKKKIFRVGAIFLFGATLLKLLFVDSNKFGPIEKVVSYLFTGTILLIVSFLYQKFKDRIFNDPESSVER